MHTAITSATAPAAQFVPAVLLRRRDGQVWIARDERDALRLPIGDATTLAVAESFVFASDIDHAFARCAGRSVAAAAETLGSIDGALDGALDARCRVQAGSVSVTLHRHRKVDLTETSRDTGGVLEGLFDNVRGGVHAGMPIARDAFDRKVAELVDAGVLAPRPGGIQFGDFKRVWPFSHRFGFDRGGPVDRYYLRAFLRHIHALVRGRCLEIGGSARNNHYYRFDVAEFRSLDLDESTADDLVGDAADATLFGPETWDSILAFHVLEHCPDPFRIVDNMRGWLRPGGRAFAVVPCAQRVHNFPGDYWRFMPDGLKVLFKEFSDVSVSAYGNPLTLVSSYLGLSHTELDPEDMEFVHPDYPVLACVVARK